MALKRNERYPLRFANPTPAHPQGAFKNRTSPTSQDGSYLESDWANDWDGFFARVFTVAGVTPNGNVDSGTSSQYYDALIQNIRGLWSSGAGWRRNPDGLIEQWGLITFPSGAGKVSTTVTFPIPFTSSVQLVNVFDGGFGEGNMFGATNKTLTSFTAWCNSQGEGGAYIARGY